MTEHAGDALTGKVMQSMQEMYSREGVAEIQEMCPGGSRSSLTQRAPEKNGADFKEDWSHDLCH